MHALRTRLVAHADTSRFISSMLGREVLAEAPRRLTHILEAMTKHGKGEALYRSFWDGVWDIGPNRGDRQARRIQEWLRDHRKDFHPKSLQEHRVFEIYANLEPDRYPVEENALDERRLRHLESIWSGKQIDDVLSAADSCLLELFLREASADACSGCGIDQYFYYWFARESEQVVVRCNFCGTAVDGQGRKLGESEFRIPTTAELDAGT